MIWRIDSFLIDRIFQPCADLLARCASCYRLAAFLATGGTFIYTGACCWDRFWLALGANVPFLIAVTLRAYQLSDRKISGALPIDRIRFVFVRTWLLALQLPVFAFILAAWEWPSGARETARWLIIVSLYLMACRPNPPKPRAVRRFLTATQTA